VSVSAHGYLVAGLLAATALVMRFVFKPAGNGMDLQLPSSVAALRAAVGTTDDERRRNRNNTYADFAFLSAYTALFVTAGSLLARQGPG